MSVAVSGPANGKYLVYSTMKYRKFPKKKKIGYFSLISGAFLFTIRFFSWSPRSNQFSISLAGKMAKIVENGQIDHFHPPPTIIENGIYLAGKLLIVISLYHGHDKFIAIR